MRFRVRFVVRARIGLKSDRVRVRVEVHLRFRIRVRF